MNSYSSLSGRLKDKAYRVLGVATPSDSFSIGTEHARIKKNVNTNRRVSARRNQSTGVVTPDTLRNLGERSIRDSNVATVTMAMHPIPEESGVTGDGVPGGPRPPQLSPSDSTTSRRLPELFSLDRLDQGASILTQDAPSTSNQGSSSARGDPIPNQSTFAQNVSRRVGGTGEGAVPPTHMGISEQAGIPSDNAASSGAVALSHPCVSCGRSFSTKSGLGVHIRRAHPDLSDERNVRLDKKARWSDEEVSLLASTEADLIHSGGIRFMNHALHERFVLRSVEAIKKVRQREVYKAKVQAFLCRLVASNNGPQGGAGALVPDLREMSSQNIAEEVLPIVEDPIKTFLLSLDDLDHGFYRASYLNSIVQLVVENDKNHVLHRLSSYLEEIFPPSLRTRRRAIPRAPPTFTNRRRRRRHEYAEVQRNWRRHCGRCIKTILDGSESSPQPPRNVMEPFWRRIFEEQDPSGPQMSDLKRYLRGDVWHPITHDEIRSAMPSLTTSPGPDGITSRQVRAIPLDILSRVFNLMMWCGKVPRQLRVAQTIFLAKKQEPSLPEDYRPITLAPILIRVFHSILAKRISSSIEFERSQRGFMPTDGCADNTTLIDLLLRESHQSYESCYIAVLDVSKAFDSVSHNTIFGTLKSFGLPDGLVEYIQHVYENSTTKFVGDSWESENGIVCGRGVKQGDPLSPVLFNLVIDRLIRLLPPDIGCRIGNHVLNIAAFADDLVIFASTPMGLQRLLDIVSEFLRTCGLRLNKAKCFTMSIKGQPKQKKSVVVQREFLIEQQPIRSLKRTDEWKYLGVTFTAEGKTKVELKANLIEKLDRLTRAPLKPQQRLFALRTVLIPQLYHVLTLGNVMIGCLNGIDRTVRQYVRKWLSLPDDVPVAFFHALVEDGGLGIVSLRWQAPLMRLERLRNLQLPLPSGIVTVNTFLASEIAKVERRLQIGVDRILSGGDLRKYWANRLYAAIDGRGLLHSSDHHPAHRWIREPTRLLTGRDFINCIKLRINALPTRSRCSRGRTSERSCRAGCDAQETLNHIVQGCYRTKRDRTNRHDSVIKYIDRKLRGRGFQTVVEGRLQTIDGVRKPDIVALKGQEIYVLDAQVVTDGRNMSDMHKVKRAKYNTEGVIRALRDRYQREQMHFGAITLNWRGIWCRDSVLDLIRWGVIERKDTALISTRVMIGGISSHRRFLNSVNFRSGIG